MLDHVTVNMSELLNNAMAMIWPYVGTYLELVRVFINETCKDLEPWQVVSYTFGGTMLTVWIWDFLFQPDQTLKERFLKSFFRHLRSVPYVRGKIDQEMATTSKELKANFDKKAGDGYITHLPAVGYSEEKVLEEVKKYKKLADVNWSQGLCSGTVYSGEDDLTRLMSTVYGEFAWTNPLHPDVFPDIRKMEAEVVRMTCNMFNGDEDSCGCMTAGGTESIMLACLAYRNMAYERGVKYPEMIVPHTAHAAFDKGAWYFKIKIKHIPVDEKTRKVDVKAMKKAINKNTCMLAGSAPAFPHGIMDSIFEIARLGLQYKIPVHVDSCLGGFLVPFMKKAGFEIEPFDFSVPGVTSISADTHKFGFAPKGSSVIMYSHEKYRAYGYFVQPDWPGGIYATPTFAGSRAGAIIAACWATLMYIGESGYIETTRKIIETAKYIADGLSTIEGIFVYGDPKVCVVGFGSNDFNVYRLADALTHIGWNLNALQYPSSIHICVTLLHTKPGVADRFINDVRRMTQEVMKSPNDKASGQAAIYGLAQSIPDRSLVGSMAGKFYNAYYNTVGIAKENKTP